MIYKREDLYLILSLGILEYTNSFFKFNFDAKFRLD